jgi:UDP-N-acetylmuramoyl-tripeptide--D-alanyl-D-alanine ligase
MKKELILFFLWYLRILAKLQLLKNNPTIIGITGSAGKTSTLNAVEAVLKNYQKIKVSHKANSETGLPLNILELSPKSFTVLEWMIMTLKAPMQLILSWPKYRVYVAEMAIDSPLPPKNMDYLLKILRPQVGIFMNAKPMHSQPFDYLVKTDDLEERKVAIARLIAEEKGKLITQLPETGWAILNADDPNSILFKNRTKAMVLTVGHHQSGDIQVTAVNADLHKTIIKLKYQEEIAKIELPGLALPDHYGLTAAFGVAAGITQGMNFLQACDEFEQNFKIPNGRASLIEGKNNSVILDSSYNASAQAVVDMLYLLKKLSDGSDKKHKIAILGDMRELGQVSKIEHQKIADVATQTCDLVCLVGPQMKDFALPILQNSTVETHWFESATLAGKFVESRINNQTIVLVKGSQNTLLLEIAVELLMAKPEQADKLLCRRGNYWDQVREKLI